MITVESKMKSGGVDVHTIVEGMSIEVLEESTAIIKCLYEDIIVTNNLDIPFLTVLGMYVSEWMETAIGKKGDEHIA